MFFDIIVEHNYFSKYLHAFDNEYLSYCRAIFVINIVHGSITP